MMVFGRVTRFSDFFFFSVIPTRVEVINQMLHCRNIGYKSISLNFYNVYPFQRLIWNLDEGAILSFL